jgi:hypothetical protein
MSLFASMLCSARAFGNHTQKRIRQATADCRKVGLPSDQDHKHDSCNSTNAHRVILRLLAVRRLQVPRLQREHRVAHRVAVRRRAARRARPVPLERDAVFTECLRVRVAVIIVDVEEHLAARFAARCDGPLQRRRTRLKCAVPRTLLLPAACGYAAVQGGCPRQS